MDKENTAVVLNDQWKSGGQCSHCRRTNYCKTQCRANRMAIQAMTRKIIRERLGINKAVEAIKNLGGEVQEQ